MDVRLETLEDGRLHVLGSGASGIVRFLHLPRVLVSTPVYLELSLGHRAPADNSLEDGRLHVLGSGAYGIVRFLHLRASLSARLCTLSCHWGTELLQTCAFATA